MGGGTIVDCLGYVASILVAFSFVMKSMAKLRLVNTMGSICFIIYAVAIHAIPVALINCFAVCVNIYYLTKGAVRINS
jgi:hypothetical protein